MWMNKSVLRTPYELPLFLNGVMKLLLSLMFISAVIVMVPNTFAQEDYMTLDKQNYSDGEIVKMSGFIEGKGGHVLAIIIVNPSGELKSAGHSYGPSDSFGIETRIMPISWDDGIYKIVASSVGKEFVEIFGVNYILTEDDIVKYKQEEERKKTIKQVKKSPRQSCGSEGRHVRLYTG